MSQQDNTTTVALVVSLVALLVSFVQLLQTLLNTAEGFKRTNRPTMGAFVETKRKIFHASELRIETTFSTPHFIFNTKAVAEAARAVPRTGKRHIVSRYSAQTKGSQPFHLSRNASRELPGFVRSTTELMNYQILRNALSRWFPAAENVLIRPADRAYAAGWLLLIEQLCEYDAIYYTQSPVAYIYRSRNNFNIFDPAELHLPAIQCVPRSWDLQPSAVSRPLASIELRDLLTLCFRLRIHVAEHNSQSFRASGRGHTFSPLKVQGAGLVVEYRYTASESTSQGEHESPGNVLFVPTKAADQLAFGIIPPNPALGISRSWDLQQGDMIYSMNEHWKTLGISENYCEILRSSTDPDKSDIQRMYYDTVLLLVPVLSPDGLGIVKYHWPLRAGWTQSMMNVRESRIVLRTRLNEMQKDAMPDKQSIWISESLNELAEWDSFGWGRPMFHEFDRNAETDSQHKKLHFLRTNLHKADNYLSQTCKGGYPDFVAAHMEMAVEVLGQVQRAVREGKTEAFRTDDTVTSDMSGWMTEVMHRYIDAALEGRISSLYRSKDNRQALDDHQVHEAWFTMIFRGIMWQACHLPIALPWMPYQSKLYKDETMIMIA